MRRRNRTTDAHRCGAAEGRHEEKGGAGVKKYILLILNIRHGFSGILRQWAQQRGVA